MSLFRVCIPVRPGIPDIFHSRIAGNETDTIPGNENSPGRDTNHSNRGYPVSLRVMGFLKISNVIWPSVAYSGGDWCGLKPPPRLY